MRTLSLPPRRLIPRVLVPILGSLLALAVLHGPSQATDGRTFVIANMDGYGLGDCLTQRSDCGQMVADAWCSAHGMPHAIAFGSARDVTGSIGAATKLDPNAAVVTCGE